MFKVPDEILERLKCHHCGGFLNSKPIKLKCPNENQICGLCFEVYSKDEKAMCHSQSALEAMAEAFIFPCRYRANGCRQEFGFNKGITHENKCNFKYLLPNELRDTTETLINSRPTSNIYTELSPEHYNSNDQTEELLTNESSIAGYLNNLHQISRNKNASTVASNIKYDMLHSASLLTLNESRVNLLNSSNSICDENIYESLYSDNKNSLQCNGCLKEIEGTIDTCLFGHPSCQSCKGSLCLVCHSKILKEPKVRCKNFKNGCTVFEELDSLHKHETGCEFNMYSCPLKNCSFNHILSELKKHILSYHSSIVKDKILSSTFGKDDEDYIIIFDNNFFVCANVKATKYRYVVTTASKDKKSSVCISRNQVSLSKGVQFDLYKLKAPKDCNKLPFSADISICNNL